MSKTMIEIARAALVAVLVSSLAACGGTDNSSTGSTGTASTSTGSSSSSGTTSSSGSSSQTSNSNATVNAVPQIQGTPGTTAVVGQAYSFTPTASDSNHDALTFSIAGKPSWASFDTATGRLSGTPAAGDVRSYDGIVISVSDGQSTVALAQFSINVVAQTNGSATLSWQAPTQNTDGTALTSLSGYKILYGTQSGQYSQTITINNAGITRYVVENLAPGHYFFAMKTVASNGTESDVSGEAGVTI